MLLHPYTCDVDAESIHRYRPGGYHPVSLSDQLKSGRYKIFHKVGWDGYSTTWAARDQVHETQLLRLISPVPSDAHTGRGHIVQLLDSFYIDSPNGKHQCLVLELLGPSVPDIVDFYCRDERLAAQVAKSIAHQALVGVDFLAQLNVCHGDMPNVDLVNEQELVNTLGRPEIGLVKRTDGSVPEIHVPPYIVRPTTFKAKDVLQLRAPEVLFDDLIDRRVDLWSLSCLFFELFTCQPPFDSIMITPTSLDSQMIQFSTDKLPDRWEEK
ncbi:kinase-like domain-containing protein [Xylaria longipes]|nr:kinase-like domain-containing protein [Xylaria longipes]